MKRLLVIFVCLLFIGTIFIASCAVAPKPDKPGKPGGGKDTIGTEYQITDYTSWEQGSTIYGTKIVYSNYHYGFNVFMYELGADGIPNTNDANEGEYQITTDTRVDDWSNIYGNYITYRREIAPGNRDVFMYYLGADGLPNTNDNNEGEYRITNTEAVNSKADMDGNSLTYKYSQQYIVVHDLGADGLPGGGDDDIDQVPSSTGSSSPPSIYDDNVVFSDSGDIFIYSISAATTTRITKDYTQEKPDIYGNIIVWSDNRNEDMDIYCYDLGPDGKYGTSDDVGESMVCSQDKPDSDPRIQGNRIVWYNWAVKNRPVKPGQFHYISYNSDIYMHDLTTSSTSKISSSTKARLPDIFGDHIVWDDARDNNWDVYLFILD